MDIILFRKADGDNTNLFLLRHATDGGIKLFIYGSNGAAIISNASFGAWLPTSGREYEISICPNITAGATRLFIDGIQLGSAMTQTGIRSSDVGQLITGTNANYTDKSNFKVDDLCFFDTVLYTENYTPGYTLSDYVYTETSDVLPEIEHTGDGSIKLFNSFSMIYTGSPRILLEIGRSGNKLYWDGDSWEISDESYDQATDPITFNTNCGSLDVDGEKYGQFTVVYPSSNTQSSISELTANMNVDIGYLTTNPYGKINTGFRTDELLDFIATIQKTGNDEIKFILENESNYYYWNGSSWITGSLQYSNSTTADDIETNKSSLVEKSSYCYIYFFLHSDDGTTTPELNNLYIEFSYGGEEPDTLNKCLVWGYFFDSQGNPLADSFKIRLNKHIVQYKNYSSILKNDDITVTIDESGYAEVYLVENENMISPDGEDV